MKRLLFLILFAVTASAHRGREVYTSGAGTAAVAGNEMSATMFPCANCHGADGRGVAEGGVVPSNVTWLELTKPYRAATPNGRRRPAYNEQTLRRAITKGVDSAGNPLHAAMPRYTMAEPDLSALVSYLKVLGTESVPGVTATEVRIGTIAPEGAIGQQMAAVLSAYFKDAGEIHGRRVTLDVVTPAKLDATLASAPPFAFAGGVIIGADERVEQAVERAGVPLVLPLSMRSDSSAENRQRFYLSPGIEPQLYGMLRFSRDQAWNLKRVMVIARDEQLIALARRTAARLEQPPEVVIVDSSARVPADLDDSTAVIFLDPDASLSGVPATGKPRLLFLGNLLPEDFFKASRNYGGRILVALTTTPAHLGGIAEYRAFATRHKIASTQVASQLSAYAAAKALVHALKQSGRTLTRDALRTALEGLYEFETGVTPPLTFGRSRRIAAPRIHVATIDPKQGTFVPAGNFTIER
jgi:mono/diheme cytochrome c family protein